MKTREQLRDERAALAQPALVPELQGGLDVAVDRLEIPVSGWGQFPIVHVPWNVFDRAVMWVEDRRRYGDDGTIVDDWMALKAIQRAALAQPSPAPESAAVLPPFAEKVLAKLRRFEECASDFDSGGVDIGRHWLDLLTQLGLLNRVQRSPALWEISQQGEDLLEAPGAQAGRVPAGFTLVPEHDGVDAIVTALYRRFKEWSARGFGPEDVTWCEVKADLLALIAAAPAKGGE